MNKSVCLVKKKNNEECLIISYSHVCEITFIWPIVQTDIQFTIITNQRLSYCFSSLLEK